MSGIHKYKKIENYNIFKKVKNENNNDKKDKIHRYLTNKYKNIINMDTIFSKCNINYSRNMKCVQKSINEKEYLSQKNYRKKITINNSNIHNKSPTNFEIDYNFLIKPDLNSEMKKITEKKKFENKAHRRIKTEKRTIEINKKNNKNGTSYILIKTRNRKKNNNEFSSEYFFEGKNNELSVYNTNNSLKNTNYVNLTINLHKSFQKKNLIKK